MVKDIVNLDLLEFFNALRASFKELEDAANASGYKAA